MLTSLHNGCIQLWDYRMCTMIDKFEEHDGETFDCYEHVNDFTCLKNWSSDDKLLPSSRTCFCFLSIRYFRCLYCIFSSL